jgi:hypothetical protein
MNNNFMLPSGTVNKCLKGLGLCWLVVLTMLPSATWAAAAPKAAPATASDKDISSTLVQNYKADSSVLTGMIVGFKGQDKSAVVPLTSKTARDMLGIVVSAGSATFTLTSQAAGTQQVLVAPSGNYPALVSTQGGNVKSGDYLTMSALPGIAMKASAYQEQIIGTANGDFSGGSHSIASVPVKNNTGQKVNVAIGTVAIALRLAPNPTYVRNNSLPGVITASANAVANKSVSLIQIYLSLSLLILTFFVVGIIFYGAVRSSIISIGRNPLSKRSVIAGLLKVLFLGVAILGSGLVGSYLVLKF